jgi:hypothetical protein
VKIFPRNETNLVEVMKNDELQCVFRIRLHTLGNLAETVDNVVVFEAVRHPGRLSQEKH